MKKKIEGLKHCLIIDDDEAMNFLNQIIIQELNYDIDILIKKNGKEAIEYLREFNPENPDLKGLVLLDLNMPLMNGWEFLEAYKEMPETIKENLKVVVLTSSINPKDREKAFSYSEIVDFFDKPLSTEKLEELITNLYLN